MKPLTVVCLSLLMIVSGLKLNSGLFTGTKHDVKHYWHKRVRKEKLRDAVVNNTISNAIDNSVYFITCGLPAKFHSF